MQTSATMTTAAHLPIPSFPRNNSALYTAMSGSSSYLPPFTSPIATGYPAMHTNYLYGSSVNISPHNFPTSSAAGFGAFSPTEPGLNGVSLSPVNKHHHPIADQLSPSSTNHHPHRQRIASTNNENLSPLPTPSPPAHSPSNSSLLPTFPPVNPPLSHTHKNYPLPPNGFHTNNSIYFPGATPGLNGSTQQHLLQNSASHTPTTLNGSIFNPSSYTPNLSHLPSLPAVNPLPSAPASTVSMFPSQLPTHGQGDYSQQSATNVSSSSLPAPLNMNLWGSANTYSYPLPNQVHPMHKLSYDTPRYKLTPERATPLVKWFDEHKDHPYPSRHEKILLCQQTQLTFTQVSTWFANCRRRMKKANQEEEERNSTHGSTSGSDSPGPHSNSSCVSDDQGLEGHSTDPPRENGDISSTAPHSYSSRHDTD